MNCNIDNFWDYIISDYIISIFKKHIPLTKEYSVCLLEDKHIKELFDDIDYNHIAFFTPIIREYDKEWYLRTFNSKMENIKGYIVVNIDNLKETSVDYDEAVFLSGYSLINAIKYTMIHECRHAQQNYILRKLFNEDLNKIDKLMTLDSKEGILGVFEHDACVYGISYVSNLYHNYQKNANKNLINMIYKYYGEELNLKEDKKDESNI